jgi:uncharacterized protein (TIGR02996 family)
MPPGSEPLLAAVCAAPWDDLPRLVVADFLDDHGEHDQAEFIRVQCATVGVRKLDPRCRRAAALLRANRERWAAELPRVGGSLWVGWRGLYRRGFAADVYVHDKMLAARRLAEAVAAAPVQSVTLHADADGYLAVAGSAHLAGLTRLEVADWGERGIDDAAAERLAANPAAGRLRTLWLSGRERYGWLGRRERRLLTDRAAFALAGSRTLRRLATVRLTGADLSADGVAALTGRYGGDVRVSP